MEKQEIFLHSSTHSHPIRDTFVLSVNNELVGPNLPFYYCKINANKIIDGLFIGNQDSAQDLEFLLSIKCKYVINCAGSSVPNIFARFGIRYLTFRWFDSRNCTIFDAHAKIVHQIHRFIENAHKRGNTVLIHSVHGNNRSCLACAAYLMFKFQWSVQKCLEFVAYKRPETNPKAYFVKQLIKCAKHLKIIESKTATIEDRWCKSQFLTIEESVITNTFLNSHSIQMNVILNTNENAHQISTNNNNSTANKKKKKKKNLRWAEKLVDICPADHSFSNNNNNYRDCIQPQSNSSLNIFIPAANDSIQPTSILRVHMKKRPSTPTINPNKPPSKIMCYASNISTNDEHLHSTLSYLSNTFNSLGIKDNIEGRSHSNANTNRNNIQSSFNKQIKQRQACTVLQNQHLSSSIISDLRVIGRSNNNLHQNRNHKKRNKSRIMINNKLRNKRNSYSSQNNASNSGTSIMIGNRNRRIIKAKSHFSSSSKNNSNRTRNRNRNMNNNSIKRNASFDGLSIGINNNYKGKNSNRPRSALIPKNKSNSSLANIRQRSTSAKPTNNKNNKHSNSTTKQLTQFRRVGW